MTTVKKPRGIRHDRHCERCRANGIKCDLNRPRCQPCVQSGAGCQYPQRVIWMGNKERRKEQPASKQSPSSSSPVSLARDRSLQEPQQLGVQSNKHIKHIPINLNGFIDLLSEFYQEIQSSKQELPNETIELISQTLSYARLRLQGANDDDAIQSHLVALTNLSRVIDSAHPIALFGIGTFAMFEVCCGSFGNWQRHLHGARSLLDLHCTNKAELDGLTDRIPGLADVLAYLVWFDVTGTLNRGDNDLIFDNWHREILTQDFLDWVGCPPDTFELFVHLAKGEHDANPLDLSAMAMQQILRINNNDSTDLSLADVAYRGSAAMVSFACAAESSLSSSPSIHADVISSLVDKVCDAISKMPTSSRFYVHLATSAYLTGMHASTSDQCDVVRGYWRNCQLCDFPRYPDGQEQCERRWRDKGII